MEFALTNARPDELPGLLAHLLSVAPPVDIAKYLAPCGRVQMRVDGVPHLVALPAIPGKVFAVCRGGSGYVDASE